MTKANTNTPQSGNAPHETHALRDGLVISANAQRVLIVEKNTIDEAARTVTLAFASETPVSRYWGNEILTCDTSSMRADRLNRGANMLCHHDITDVVGVVQSHSIGADKVCRAVIRFGKSERASEIFQDIVDGIRQNVSVGYLIHELRLESEIDGVATYRITDWEPYEISMVSVPADLNVGVGRSADIPTAPAPAPTITIPTPANNPNHPTRTMPQQAENQSIATNIPATPVAPVVVTPAQRSHHAEIAVLAEQSGQRELGLAAIQAGHTVEQFQRALIDKMSNAPKPTAEIGMTANEARSYSLVRALNALANPNDAAAQRAAAFERECSDAVATKSGKSATGIFMPFDVQKRELLAGTATAGGNLIATNLLAGSFIDILRNAMVIDKLGIVTLAGLVGKVAIPKQTAAATAYWVTEGNAPNESQQAIGQVTMDMKTVGAYTDFTRDLLRQSSISVEQFVQNDLAKVVGLGLQQAVINGSGGGTPKGVMTQIAATSLGANGAALNWANVVGMETAVSVGNADVGTLGYLTNAKVRGALKVTEKFATTNGQPVWTDDKATPLNGYGAAVTNAVPSNLTKGSGTALSAMIFGNWADVIIGLWGTLDLTIDPYTFSTTGAVRIVALQSADIALRNVESFCVYNDIKTA